MRVRERERPRPVPLPPACPEKGMTRVRYSLVSSAIILQAICCCLGHTSAEDGVAAAGRCRPSSCGDVTSISYPFRLRGDPQQCGHPQYELTCEDNRTILTTHNSAKYFVRAIWYDDQMLQVADARLWSRSPPLTSCSCIRNFLDDERFKYALRGFIMFMKCSVPVEDPPFVDATCCIGAAASTSNAHWYAFLGDSLPLAAWHLPRSCRVVGNVPVGYRRPPLGENISHCSGVHDMLLQGFNMSWWKPYCMEHRQKCRRPYDPCYGLLAISGRAVIGYLCLIAYFVYKFRRRHRAMDYRTENFLSEYRSFMPTRYSYRQIKKMTRGFQEKLGQGGFGSVFKGKLLIGRPAAIKMLGRSKGNGQEFINEVATIGRIHHANVVHLLGFCAEGSNRALVYEFLPNGSLDKYIFPRGEASNDPLSWQQLLNIAVGVARGMEYLHRGCDMQILHFDIKPHNILLDQNFNPKISDFGLAKVYPVEDSKVSITAVRGTIGYIAPELFYRKVGCVSSKSDVYSFGMLLMELAGKRRNVNAHVEHSSQMYFPSWVYDQLEQGGDMGIADATHEEREIVKKMVTVALWCIQMNPIDRPTMTQVLEMLERNTEQLQMPPKPFLSSPNHVIDDDTAVWDEASDTSLLGTYQCTSDQITQEDQGDTSLV